MRIYKVILEHLLSNKIKHYESIDADTLPADYIDKLKKSVYFVDSCEFYIDMDNDKCEHIVSKEIIKILKRDVYISKI